MKLLKPKYFGKISPNFIKYFDENKFKGKNYYPSTIIDANNYVLFDCLHADAEKINVEIDKKSVELNRKNYKKAFNFKIWSKLPDETKIVLMYWFFCERVNKMNAPKDTDFVIILNSENQNGHNHFSTYCNYVYVNSDRIFGDKLSAFEPIRTMLHELDHNIYSRLDHKNYMDDQNLQTYYVFNSNLDNAEHYYSYLLYFFQPEELHAELYSYSETKKLLKSITKSPSSTDMASIVNYAYLIKRNSELKKIMFKDKFDEHLDMYYLLGDINAEYKSSKTSKERKKELKKDLIDLKKLIDEEKAEFIKNYKDFLKNEIQKMD